MNYSQFVKANYSKFSHLPPKERFAEIAKLWHAKSHKTKGGSLSVEQIPGAISTVMHEFGLGMKPLKRGRKARGGAVVGGNDDEHGGGIFGDLLGAVGLGMHKQKRGRKAKGGAVVGGSDDEHGGGILSGLLGAVGLGMPNTTKLKHFKKMVALEKKFHHSGELTPAEHQKLKVYHHLHGAGFFDSLWSGVKKGVSTVVNAIPSAISNIGQVAKVVPEIIKFVPDSLKNQLTNTVLNNVPSIAKFAVPALTRVLA